MRRRLYESNGKVIGRDRVGIIAGVCSLLAENEVNIMDISQTIMQGYFTMMMMVDISSCRTRFADLSDRLSEKGEELACPSAYSVRIFFEAMHRI